ncbi:MAG: DUF6350 family protein [Candidatus Nanopelagicales bacterium]
MTTSSGVPARARRTDSRHSAVAGVAAALWALASGLAVLSIIVLLVWVSAPDSAGAAVGAWRAAALVWLGAHLAPMTIGDRSLSLLPLGAVLPPLLLLRMAGRWASRLLPRMRPGEAVSVVLAGAGTYGVGAMVAAWLAGSDGTRMVLWQAGLATGSVAALGLLWGVAEPVGLIPGLRARLSEGSWRALRGGLAALLALWTAGALLVSLALVIQFSDMVAVLRSLSAGLAGDVTLTVLGLAALPTLAVWGMALLGGGTVFFGSSGQLSAFSGGELGQLPALPVLAALPAEVPSWVRFALIVPVLAGVMAARVRWGQEWPTVGGVAIGSAWLAGVVGVGSALLMHLASGSLGGAQMAAVGPGISMAVGSLVGLSVLGFVLQALGVEANLAWAMHRAERRVARTLAIDLRDRRSDGDSFFDGADALTLVSTAGVPATAADDTATGADFTSADFGDATVLVVSADADAEADQAELGDDPEPGQAPADATGSGQPDPGF